MRRAYLRDQYGTCFATILPDGTEVAWRPLSIGEFIEYDRLIKSGLYPLAYIENEVFIKCVQNKYLVDSIDTLNAGIISSVAATIIQYSGPHTIEELNYLLNLHRNTPQKILHQLINFIF